MHDISTILCVIDPTTKEQPALSRARALAAALGAKLELFACYYNEYLSGGVLFDSPSLEKARVDVLERQEADLEKYAAPLRQDGIPVSVHATWDHPLYEGIVRRAGEVEADIVIKDTHHHSAVERAFFTNTDWSLIRTCPVPLWLVKPTAADAPSVFLAAIDPLNEHDKPAALDDEILKLSNRLAHKFKGKVHAFHAYDPRMAVATATANAYIPVSLPFDEIEQQMRDQHKGRFDEVTDYHDINKDRAHLVAGLTHEELPALAEEIAADVVVMGAVSRNRWQRLFIGATAERTLEQLPCDLLIIKPDWFKTPVQMRNDQAA